MKDKYRNKLVEYIDEIPLFKDSSDKIPIFKKGDVCLCLGEIQNMKEHLIIVSYFGNIIWGWHNEHFRILKDRET